MHLYLVRHADALNAFEANVSSDKERPLSEEGRTFLKKALIQLKTKIPPLQHCLVSPYVRAQETADILLSGISCEQEKEIFEDLTPESSPKIILKFLEQKQDEDHIMLVGHEPYMGLLLGTLLTGCLGTSMPFSKGGIAHVEVFALPAQGTLPHLHWFLNPPPY